MAKEVTKISHDNPKIDPYRTLGRSIRKEIFAYSDDGVFLESDNLVKDICDGVETQYVVRKIDHSIKSRITYFEGQLHGESIIFNDKSQAVKREVYGLGKLIYKYLFNEALEAIGVEMIDEASVDNLPTSELELLKALMIDKPEWFTK